MLDWTMIAGMVSMLFLVRFFQNLVTFVHQCQSIFQDFDGNKHQNANSNNVKDVVCLLDMALDDYHALFNGVLMVLHFFLSTFEENRLPMTSAWLVVQLVQLE